MLAIMGEDRHHILCFICDECGNIFNWGTHPHVGAYHRRSFLAPTEALYVMMLQCVRWQSENLIKLTCSCCLTSNGPSQIQVLMWEIYFGQIIYCLKRGPYFNESEVRSFDQQEASVQIKSNYVPLSSVIAMVGFQIVFSSKYLSTMIAEQKRFFGSLVCYSV